MKPMLCAVLVVSLVSVSLGEAAKQAASQKVFVFKTVGERQLKVHFDFPPGWKPTDKRPVIVFFFGGGWTNGSVGAFSRQAAYFASRGLVAARPDYRIKSRDGVKPDACVRDARSAVRWIRTNAGRLGVDPTRLVASGGSAGGHLAACMIIDTSVETPGDDLTVPTMPQAMVLFNPVLDFTHPQLIRRIAGDKELARKISPLLHVSAKTPPAILFFGSRDRLKVHGDAYWKKAEELGFRAERFIAEGERHGFFNFTPWRQRTIIEADKFLASLGFLEGEPTMKEPTGEELKRLLQRERKRKQRRGQGRRREGTPR